MPDNAPAHYTYQSPNTRLLNQGDVLQKTPDLLAALSQYHSYYASNPDYKYFIVLTQTCDLVHRDGQCNSPYITIAAVRPSCCEKRRRTIVGRCEINEESFTNDEMSAALWFGESLWDRINRLAEHYETSGADGAKILREIQQNVLELMLDRVNE